MRKALFVFLFISFVASSYAYEIPDLTFDEHNDYPEGPQDGSPGSVLDPANMTYYDGYYLIQYIPVTSYNPIDVEPGTAVIFRIFTPPYVEKFSVSINGPGGMATQALRAAVISEDPIIAPFPAEYVEGSLGDDEWKWLYSHNNYVHHRDPAYFNVGSAAFLVMYNGANVDDDWDGVPDGDFPYTLTIGHFGMSWSIPEENEQDYIDWATGPLPIPDGSRGTLPMTVERITPEGGMLLHWDDQCTPNAADNVIYGPLDQVSSHTVTGSLCSVIQPATWDPPPSESVWFVVVGESDDHRESSWGLASTGGERHGSVESGRCGVVSKYDIKTCP